MLLSLARFIMSGPWQGIVLAPLLFLHPWTSWLSLAILGLVGLRQGPFNAGLIVLSVLLIQLLPARTFQLIDIVSVTVVFIASQVLRKTVRLDWALLAVTGSAFLGLAVIKLTAGFVFEPIVENYRIFHETLSKELSAAVNEAWNQQDLFVLAVESVAWAVAIKSCIALFLARWWQAQLYNPGGFKNEFLSLKFVPAVVWGLSLGYLSTVLFLSQWSPLAQLFRIPLFFGGLAVTMWWFVEKEVMMVWRVIFFASLLITHPFVVLLGVFDSFWNLRKKMTR